MQQRLLRLFLASWLVAISAWAGSASGGGGSAVRLEDGRLVLWDLYVASHGHPAAETYSRTTHFDEDTDTSPIDLVRVDYRWKWESDPVPNPAIAFAVKAIDEAPALSPTLKLFLRFTLQYNLIASHTDLPLAFDARGTFVPDWAKAAGEKLQTVSWFLPEAGVVFQKDRFNALGVQSQAGLLVHEALRRIQLLVGTSLSVEQIQDLTAAICLKQPALTPAAFLQNFQTLVGGDSLYRRFFDTETVETLHRTEQKLGFVWAYQFDITEGELLERIQHFVDSVENRLRLKGLQQNLNAASPESSVPVTQALAELKATLGEQIAKDEGQPSFDTAPTVPLIPGPFSMFGLYVGGDKILTDLGGIKAEEDFGFDGKRRGVCGVVSERFLRTGLVQSASPTVQDAVERACQRTPSATWGNRASADDGLNEFVKKEIEAYSVALMARRIGDANLIAAGWTTHRLQLLYYSAGEMFSLRNKLDAGEAKEHGDSQQRYLWRQVQSVNALLRLYLIHEGALDSKHHLSLDFFIGFEG